MKIRSVFEGAVFVSEKEFATGTGSRAFNLNGRFVPLYSYCAIISSIKQCIWNVVIESRTILYVLIYARLVLLALE